ncbi:hypothetical protein IFM89_013490 [Coptis chinensis]|uniref:F-box domain-containing protein n=1 Tax=Coptis chinensis TaxID=261450 RepID=A0A835H512_9MAGN|nr:hypothetical protein IFM89_013490 [Coptis chinensis]
MAIITTSNVVLPEDVVFCLLLCLPVASLLRFKSVCKSWRALIESSSFVNRHHFKDDYNNYSLIVMNPSAFGRPAPNPDLYVSLLSGNSLEASVKLDLPDCCNVNLYNDSINVVISISGGMIGRTNGGQISNPLTAGFPENTDETLFQIWLLSDMNMVGIMF